MSAIVVGYMTVDTALCNHRWDDPEHNESHCIHDWRVRWGNVERVSE